ncbi:MAG: GYD domain-containing protein [Alphaproteobacteria bacterium]|nr:MAG: GYD domain-containing protein [Alphaproteobacteria bacterium]
MPKYLISASYSAEGLRGLQKDKASGRRQAVTAAVEGLGGKVECFYNALGADDVYVIVDLPDNSTGAVIGVTASATGLVRTRTTALLTVEETDRALERTINYRPPGA